MVSSRRLTFSVLATAVFALVIGASGARPAKSDAVTINMLISSTGKPGWRVLIPNFERVYPNVTVNATYLQANLLPQFDMNDSFPALLGEVSCAKVLSASHRPAESPSSRSPSSARLTVQKVSYSSGVGGRSSAMRVSRKRRSASVWVRVSACE